MAEYEDKLDLHEDIYKTFPCRRSQINMLKALWGEVAIDLQLSICLAEIFQNFFLTNIDVYQNIRSNNKK